MATKTPKTILDPKQAEFFKNYLDPTSKTFSNAYESALSVGYSEEYSKVITRSINKWFNENEEVRSGQMLQRAERNLNEFLDEQKDLKVKADITKFVAERIGKKKYSLKTEVEHSGEIAVKEVNPEIEKLSELIYQSYIKK